MKMRSLPFTALVLGVSRASSTTFDFKLLQAKANKLRPLRIDHATYIGPVEVRETISKGRGLFATKSMKVADLLLCEKAFAYALTDEVSDSNASPTAPLDIETGRCFSGGEADIIRFIAQKLCCNPSTASNFTNPYHGDYKAMDVLSVDRKPVVDT